MFLTITINTNKKKKSVIKMHKRKITPTAGWKKSIKGRKRSLVQKMNSSLRNWKKSWSKVQYKIGQGQIAMF